MNAVIYFAVFVVKFVSVINSNYGEIWEIVSHEKVRFKCLFITAYGFHVVFEHINPESAGVLACVVEIIHVLTE